MLWKRQGNGFVRLAVCIAAVVFCANCTFPNYVFAPESSDDADVWSFGMPVADRDSGIGALPAGRVAFFDDFESGSDGRWQRDRFGTWMVVTSGGNQVFEQPLVSSQPALVIAEAADWRDHSVEARVKLLRFGGADDTDFVALYGRCQNGNNSYALAIRGDGRLAIRKRVSGDVFWLASTVLSSIELGVWYTLRLEFSGTRIRGSLEGHDVLEADDGSLRSGTVAVGMTNAAAQFDEVRVTLH